MEKQPRFELVPNEIPCMQENVCSGLELAFCREKCYFGSQRSWECPDVSVAYSIPSLGTSKKQNKTVFQHLNAPYVLNINH